MSQISSYLALGCVVLDAAYANKKRAFEAIAQLFEDQHGLARSAAYDALLNRERLGSTGLGEGVAIPHGRVKGLKKTLCAVLRLAAPIPFEAPDGAPVQLMIALMVPENANQTHLDLLGELAEMLANERFRDTLFTAPDAPTLHELLSQWQP